MKILYFDVYRDAVTAMEFLVAEGKVKRLKTIKGTMQEMVVQSVSLIQERRPDKVLMEQSGISYAFSHTIRKYMDILPDGTVLYDDNSSDNG